MLASLTLLSVLVLTGADQLFKRDRGALAHSRGNAHFVAKALHDSEAQPRAFLVRGGGEKRLHGLLNVRNAAALVADLYRHPAVFKYPSAYVYNAALPAVAVHNAVRYGFGHGGFQVAELVHGGVEVHNERRHRAARERFVAAF